MNRELEWIGRVFCKLRELIPHRNAVCWVWVSNNRLCNSEYTHKDEGTIWLKWRFEPDKSFAT